MSETKPQGQLASMILKINGQSFRCPDCGSNVFHRPNPERPNKYECNGCGSRWIGEP